MNEYLSKPLDTSELHAKIVELTRKKGEKYGPTGG
jgi:hypothetical protein